MLRDIHVRRLFFFMDNGLVLMIRRAVKGIPDPIAGPKGVRTILFVRGVTGWVLAYSRGLKLSTIFPSPRFFGLSGMYWSLQYLSVADATVLVFLTPLTAAVAGTVFLKESYSIKQAVAGGESYNLPLMVHDYLWRFQPSFQFNRRCPHRKARIPIWLPSRIPRRGPWAKAGGRWVGTIHITSRSTHNLSISGRACMVSVLGNTGACTYCDCD